MSKGAGTQTTTQQLDPQAQAFREQVYNQARTVTNQPFSQYTGTRVAGFNPYMSQGVSTMGQAGSGYGDVYNAARNFQGPEDMHFGSGLDMDQKFGGSFQAQPYNQAGAIGARALGGDQGAVDQMMNPYMQNVIGAMGSQFDRMRGKSVMDVNDIATKGGAFGGDRQALLQGERLGEIDRAQSSTIADLLHGGFNDMTNRAGAAANLGLGAGGLGRDFEQMMAQYRLGVGGQNLQGQGMQADYNLGQGNLGLGSLDAAMKALGGQYGAGAGLFGAGGVYRDANQQMLDSNQQMFNEQRDWSLRGLNAMNSAMSGTPYGTTSSTPLTKNVGAGILGGATTGFTMGGPWGALAGGLLGAF